MRNIIIFLLLVITLTAMKCEKDADECHYNLLFANLSNRDVYIELLTDDNSELNRSVYNSMLLNKRSHKVGSLKFSKNNEGSLHRRQCIEGYFTQYPKIKKARLFVFDAEILENTDASVLEQQRYYLKTYEFTLNDLRNLNWRVEYSE